MLGKVYLAGPISFLTLDQANDWRRVANLELLQSGITCFSPLRGKGFLADKGPLSEHGHDGHPLSTSRGIMTRDRFDCTRADVVLANLLGAERVSIGTVMEIAWADAARVPVVLVMEAGSPHEHCMILEAAGYCVETLEEGLDIVKAILTPGVY